MFRKLRGQYFAFFVLLQVVQADSLEVADYDVARQFPILQSVQIFQCLHVGLAQRHASGFMFGNQYAGPEAVDIPGSSAQFLDALLE